jgi:dihydroorotase
MEHITTADAVKFVSPLDNVAATITAHHLLLTQFDLQAASDRITTLAGAQARGAPVGVGAVTSGNPKFFSVPTAHHTLATPREAACGCAGVYTAHAAIELYAEAFDAVVHWIGWRFRGFNKRADLHTPRLQITLCRKVCVPDELRYGDDDSRRRAGMGNLRIE